MYVDSPSNGASRVLLILSWGVTTSWAAENLELGLDSFSDRDTQPGTQFMISFSDTVGWETGIGVGPAVSSSSACLSPLGLLS